MPDQTIEAAISPEEKSELSEVIALLQSILQSGAAPEAEPVVDEIAMAQDEPPEEAVNTEELEKAIIDETGDTKAEDRLSNVPEATDDSLKKALLKLLAPKAIQKSQTNQPNALNIILNELKSIKKSVNTQAQFNDFVRDALGYTNDVVDAACPVEIAKSGPVQTIGNEGINLLIKALVDANPKPVQETETGYGAQTREVKKGLTTIAGALYQNTQGNK